MTLLKNISRFAVVLLTLIGVAAAAIPTGWIALRYEPPGADEEKGHWILVKAPEDGLTSWWSDEELAKIIAGDKDYVQRLETDWSPVDHPVADAKEAERLAEELARYWGGDVPQSNYWAHGAMVRRGSTLRAFRWEQDGEAQRQTLIDGGQRPGIPAAAVDPDPVDQRYDNQTDVVTYGERWGDHLLTATLDHVYRAELNKARRKHHPNPPPAAEVLAEAKATVQACREASLKTEMGVFENYVRGWGGLGAKSVTFGMPENCVADPGPPVVAQLVPNPILYTACDGSKHSSRAAANAVNCDPPPRTVRRQPTRPTTYTACDGSKHSSRAAANAVNCNPPPRPVRRQPTRPTTYTACDGSKHSSRTAANAVNCDPPPRPVQRQPTRPTTYTACDGSKHASRAAANAVNCAPPPRPTNKPTPRCTVSWLCGGNNPNNGGGNGGNGGGGGGGNPPLPYTACDGSKHASQTDADAVVCTPKFRACNNRLYDSQAEADAVTCTYTACDGSTHNTKAKAEAVSCDPPKIDRPQDDPQYTACDGTLHWSQADADAIDCYAEETNELCEQDPFAAGCDQF